MSFEVIPAIDVWQGRLARLGPEGPVPLGAFRGDPLEAAWFFVEAGAAWVHVVDLDRAFTGRAANLDVLLRMGELPVRVQASGGIASADEVDAALEAGADRVVLGSACLFDRPLVEFLLAAHGDRLVVGLEVVDELVVPRGADPPVQAPLDGFLEWLAPARPARFLVTDVGRVGGLGGADLERPARISARTGVPVLAAGGVASLADVTALAAQGGVEGAVVGRALYERIQLADVIRAVSGA